MRRLAGEVDLVAAFLGAEFPRLDAYVRGTEHAVARGRTVDELMESVEVRKEFVADVASFAKAYNAPPFARDHKTLVKLRAFLHSRLPPA